MAAERITFGTLYRSPAFGGDLREFCTMVEGLGYDSLWFNETVLGRGPYADTLACLAAAAACTDRIRLGTAILLLPLHNPLLVAKTVSTIDRISNGRVTLGVGVGGEWTKSFEALEVPLADRGARTNEDIEIIQKLWSGKTVSHHGRYYNFDEVELLPPPVQAPRLPVWIGGRPTARDGKNFPSLKRTALYGDGWLPYLVTPEMYQEGWRRIADYASEAGRKIEDIRPGVVVMVTLGDTREEARQTAVQEHRLVYKQEFGRIVDKYDVFGTPEQCIRGIERFIGAGVRHFVFQWRCALADSPRNVRLAGEKILPYFR